MKHPRVFHGPMREACVVVTVLVCVATMILQLWVNLQCRRQCAPHPVSLIWPGVF